MDSTKYLLIGGGLASGQAAKQLRQQEPEARITLVGEEPYVPYDRPPLSKEFMRGEKARKEVFFEQPEYFEEHCIEVILSTAVQRLDLSNKTAVLANGRTFGFEKALLATGGRPVRLSLPGQDLAGVHYLRTLDDATGISAETTPGKRAVIIGAGFIGMELASSLTQRGVHATVVETQAHIWPRFADATLAGTIQNYCAGKGVTFRTNDQVREIRGSERVSSVLMQSGDTLPCDLVCLGVGIIPNVELAQQAGLEVNNGIVADEYLQTSHPDIYAAGDVVNYLDPLFGKRRRVEHWGHAEYCGQLAAQNMAGANNRYDLVTYVWSDIFDLHLEFAGDEHEHEQVLTRGRLEDNSFTILYLKQHELKAYFAVNASAKDLPILQRLIRQKKDLTGKETQLQNATVPLKNL
ncbi:MAG TPA: FAD-dependent oxidoreductase [Nitrospiraceae bacterium]|nr:FAD-dependent oxidoreductase [Nitrospiraceae bacterium]